MGWVMGGLPHFAATVGIRGTVDQKLLQAADAGAYPSWGEWGITATIGPVC